MRLQVGQGTTIRPTWLLISDQYIVPEACFKARLVFVQLENDGFTLLYYGFQIFNVQSMCTRTMR